MKTQPEGNPVASKNPARFPRIRPSQATHLFDAPQQLQRALPLALSLGATRGRGRHYGNLSRGRGGINAKYVWIVTILHKSPCNIGLENA